MSFKNSKGALCPFLHHSVLLVLLFRLSKHHWSLIKPELSHLHTHEQTHIQWQAEMAVKGYFHEAFKNDLQTPWPHSTKSTKTLMETIWGFSVIWQTANLATAPPFSTHFERIGQTELETAWKCLFGWVCVVGSGLVCRYSPVPRKC